MHAVLIIPKTIYSRYIFDIFIRMSMFNELFVFLGYSDNVCCFSCGGTLSEWRPEDDPWVEHAYWYPKCTFLIQNKGEDFVQKVQLVKIADDDQVIHFF